MLTNFQLVEIDDIHTEEYNGSVYDLEVGGENGDHSYSIEGIVVHNSVCTTRKMTGVGYPQLSAIIECADAAHGLGGFICADGGCTVPGDLSKAFGAGADFVMLGGMLAGTDECEGEFVYEGSIDKPARTFNSLSGTWDDESTPTHIKFYGMSSKEAQVKYNGGVKDYRASEGKCVLVPYKGTVENTLKEILGGIRSMATYIGAKSMKEIPKRTTFIRVSQQINEIFGKS